MKSIQQSTTLEDGDHIRVLTVATEYKGILPEVKVQFEHQSGTSMLTIRMSREQLDRLLLEATATQQELLTEQA